MQERLLQDYGEKSLVLSTANTNSYAKRRMTLKRYTAQIVDRPTTLSDRGDSTFYHFGDNDHTSVLLPNTISFRACDVHLCAVPSSFLHLRAASLACHQHNGAASFAELWFCRAWYALHSGDE